jgi:transposase-like protein
MTEARWPLAELLAKSGAPDFLRGVAEAVLQLLMAADVEGQIGAGRHERSAERLTWRNGYRDRSFDTRLGTLQLRVPKLRQGSSFPPFLGWRRCRQPEDQREGAGGGDPGLSALRSTGSAASRRAASTTWSRRWG